LIVYLSALTMTVLVAAIFDAGCFLFWLLLLVQGGATAACQYAWPT
jgi:hypothetical protein